MLVKEEGAWGRPYWLEMLQLYAGKSLAIFLVFSNCVEVVLVLI